MCCVLLGFTLKMFDGIPSLILVIMFSSSERKSIALLVLQCRYACVPSAYCWTPAPALPATTTYVMFNPLTTVAISKLLETIGKSAYILACSIATALHSDIDQTAGLSGHLSMWENRCIHAQCVCAGRPRRAGDAAKSEVNSRGTNIPQRSLKI